MHAIVMVHKMQRMALSSHQLLPTNNTAGAGAEKADSENTRNSDNNDDDKGEEGNQQASIQRDSSQPTDEAAGSEQQ